MTNEQPQSVLEELTTIRDSLDRVRQKLYRPQGPLGADSSAALSLRRLLDVSRAMNSTLNLEDVFEVAISTLVEMFSAERGFLIVLDAQGELAFNVAVHAEKGDIDNAAAEISHTLVEEVIRTGDPVLIENALEDERLKAQMSVMALELRSAMCVPLMGRRGALGAIYVDNRIAAGRFSQSELELFALFANQAAIAIENSRLYHATQNMFLDMSMVLADAIEHRDHCTGEHVIRVVRYSTLLGSTLGLSRAALETLRFAAILHDIGKIGVSDVILSKPGALTEGEFMAIRDHPAVGAHILDNMGQQLGDIIPAVKHHHERVDGSGYPDGLRGDEIPQLSRIIAVADSFDAMTSERPYRKPMPVETAFREIEINAGTQFDPQVAQAFRGSLARQTEGRAGKPPAIEEIAAIQRELRAMVPSEAFWLSRV